MKFFLVISIVFLSLSSYPQGYIKGTWEGNIHLHDTLTKVKLNVLEQSHKRVFAILIIDQTLVGLYDSCFNGYTLHLKTDRKQILVRNEKIREREISQKKKSTLYEEVNFSASLDKNRLVGKLKLDKKEFTLALICNDLKDIKPYEISRIFNPYYHEEIQCRNQKDNVVLAGTLTLPKKEGKFPVVIIQTGSFPVERIKDEYLPTFFQSISDYLAKNGIATLYYDSRGTGKSSGIFYQSTPLELSGDLIAWHDLLSERPDIIPKQIGIIGHSEGGMIAAMAANKLNCFNQIVLLGTPGLPIREVFEKQSQLKLEAKEITGEEYELLKKIDQKTYDLMDQKAMQKAITDSIMKYKVQLKTFFGNFVESNIVRKTSTHNLFNLQVNPSDYIEKVTCPVLSLNGSNDRQVTPKDNQQALRQALIRANNKDFKIIELQGLNHLFQECKKGTISEAQEIDPSVSPKALEIISKWILEHTKEKKPSRSINGGNYKWL